MPRDNERVEWISAALRRAGLSGLVCALPENVLLLSGYWPVVGTSVAIATADGLTAVLAPEDEADLAASGWTGEVRTYLPGSLDRLVEPAQAIREPLRGLLEALGLARGTVGYEDAPIYQGASYAAMYLAGAHMRDLLNGAMSGATITSAADPIARLRSSLTGCEVDRVRLACRIVGEAFTASAGAVRPGAREPEVATAFAAPMIVRGLAHPGVQRTQAFAWCMSGPNAALAGAAYARTRNRELRAGDLVLVHCNSNVDGYWTDVTRTFVLGEPDDRQRAMYDAVFAAREAALATVRVGARAADVDGAARRVLNERGFGRYFTHGVGHNVGFSAISAEFPPRLHPASPDRLDVGMTFNLEPAIYIKDYGGIRHCDVVTVGADGPELLTPFLTEPGQLAVQL
jgi:Xaa-Pro dipeptidase